MTRQKARQLAERGVIGKVRGHGIADSDTGSEQLHPGTLPADTVVSLRQVEVRLGGRRILTEVNVDVRAGVVTGLIGANGAGKTTLMRVIVGLQPVHAGRVIRRDRAPGVALGYVPQRLELDPDAALRVTDLVGLGLDGHRWGLPRPSRARRARVAAALEAVGIADLAGARVGRLSGGETQRVLLAHALVGDPELLVLDEPLANLDPAGEHDIVALLASIAARRRIAVLVSAHVMNTLLPALDTLIYLAEGRAVCGHPDEVIQPEVLSRLYGHPVQVARVEGRVLVLTGDAGAAELPAPPAVQ
jgi:zinc/manganese transport system ATP-binding protein